MEVERCVANAVYNVAVVDLHFTASSCDQGTELGLSMSRSQVGNASPVFSDACIAGS